MKGIIKVKFFNHATRQWEYLMESEKERRFLAPPDAYRAVMDEQPRAYNESEFELEWYFTCGDCGAEVYHGPTVNVCEKCGATYDRWGDRIWTSHRK